MLHSAAKCRVPGILSKSQGSDPAKEIHLTWLSPAFFIVAVTHQRTIFSPVCPNDLTPVFRVDHLQGLLTQS